MGQYYSAVLKNEKGNMRSYYDYGLKLMEHSYFMNKYVNTICNKILNKPHNVAWVGDYAYSEEQWKNEFTEFDRLHKAYHQTKHTNKNFMEHLLINHTKKQVLDLTDYYNKAIINYHDEGRDDSWVIHPLPLLTAMGNGLGGGDYRGSKAINQNDVGIWAGDLLEIKPYDEDYKYNHDTKSWQYKDYTSVMFLFEEGY